MTDKELHKLTRNELLEIMLEQQKEIERLQKELKDTKTLLESRKMIMRRAGSIAEASLKISEVFEAAQKAADRYVMSVKASYDRGVLQKEEKPVSEAAAAETTVPKAELPEAEEPETEAFEQAASGAELPETGGRGPMLYMILGFILLASAGALFLLSRKKLIRR